MTGCKNSIGETSSAAFYCIKCIETLLKNLNPSGSQNNVSIHFGPSEATLVPAELPNAGGAGLEPAHLGGDPWWETCVNNTQHKGRQPWVKVASCPLQGPCIVRALCQEWHGQIRTRSSGSAWLVEALPSVASCNSQIRVTFWHSISCHG